MMSLRAQRGSNASVGSLPPLAKGERTISSETLPLPRPNMGSTNREGSAPVRAFRLATSAVRSVMPRRRAESTGRLAPLGAGKPASEKSSASTLLGTAPLGLQDSSLVGCDLRPSCPWATRGMSTPEAQLPQQEVSQVVRDLRPSCPWLDKRQDGTASEAVKPLKAASERILPDGTKRSLSRRPAGLPELDDSTTSGLGGTQNDEASVDKQRYRKTPRPSSKAPKVRLPTSLFSSSPPVSQRSVTNACLESASCSDSVSVKVGTPLSNNAFADTERSFPDTGEPKSDAAEPTGFATVNGEEYYPGQELSVAELPGVVASAMEDGARSSTSSCVVAVLKQQLHNAFLDQRDLGLSPTSAAIQALHRCAKAAQGQAADRYVDEAASPALPSFSACTDMLTPAAPPIMTC